MKKDINVRSPQHASPEDAPVSARGRSMKRDLSAQSGTSAASSSRLSDIAPEEVDKVVPRCQKTTLHDHARGDLDERDKPDKTGGLPRAL